jgi:hypothetical protein
VLSAEGAYPSAARISSCPSSSISACFIKRFHWFYEPSMDEASLKTSVGRWTKRSVGRVFELSVHGQRFTCFLGSRALVFSLFYSPLTEEWRAATRCVLLIFIRQRRISELYSSSHILLFLKQHIRVFHNTHISCGFRSNRFTSFALFVQRVFNSNLRV